tara:strand:+ start:177 stop:1358 length:1182 start_codon:yes stop_codon:yes gene_type:complete
MAKKLRTGFELPFSNATGANTSTLGDLNFYKDYVYKGVLEGLRTENYAMTTQYPDFSANLATTGSFYLNYDTVARTKTNGVRGAYARMGHGLMVQPFFDTSKFNSGFFYNSWVYGSVFSSFPINGHLRFLMLYDGTNSYQVYLAKNGSGVLELRISNNTTSTELATPVPVTGLNGSNWFNLICGIDNSGLITCTFNGANISFSSSISFSNLTRIGICGANGWPTNIYMDDLAINDGSGSSDNGIPNSIRAYNFFDQATLDSQTGFSTVGGSTILANLTDGDDATRVSAEADLSEMNFSLPTLSGTGMSETASNFTKIEAINVYGRQIEATKASSVLKAKVTDATSSANREEDISLPLTVANDSTTMFDDGASDWSLANLDAGNMDLKITFDKP